MGESEHERSLRHRRMVRLTIIFPIALSAALSLIMVVMSGLFVTVIEPWAGGRPIEVDLVRTSTALLPLTVLLFALLYLPSLVLMVLWLRRSW
jgi:hypothetical protein